VYVKYFHSFCESVRVNLADGVVNSVPATFYPSLPGDTSYFIEAGGMQVCDCLEYTFHFIL